MNIQINTDNHIKSNATLIKKFSITIESKLNRMSDNITLVKAHLSDENGDKNGNNDKRCMLEARLKGQQPLVVIENAESLNYALNGAINKLIRKINSINGRRHSQRDKDNKEHESDPEFIEEN